MGHRWHPWRHLQRCYPHIDVSFPSCLKFGCLGEWTADGITIDGTSNQRERRCTLTHEIVHIERGPVPNDPHLAVREERVVECITARRLISLETLIDALVWNRLRVDDELAEELWVDLPTLEHRVRDLTDGERRYIDQELERRA